MTKLIKIKVGEIYGKLEITEYLGTQEYGSSGQKRSFVKAKCLNCDSGEKRYMLSNLVRGNTESCGCVKKEKAIELSTTHGLSKTRQYGIWSNMISRCTNPKNINWINYGNRGITVCEKWKTFEGFWEDMREGYSDDLEIDRIDVDGNYFKDNCRWTSGSENAYNIRIKTNNTSGKSGVSFSKKENKWVAYIGVDKKLINLGSFLTKEEAVAVREKAEIDIYGYNKE